VFLTNALEKPVAMSETLLETDYLSREANEANLVKRSKPIMVVIGNPPYSINSINEISEDWFKLNDYHFVDGQPLGEQNPKYLLDDYVKFIRFGQWRIEQTGEGILAFITNHGYLNNPTFRGMRQQLMRAFDEIYILDLHGNSRKKETAPDGSKDENVFDIMQGVSIGVLVKHRNGKQQPARVFQRDIWGLRQFKYSELLKPEMIGETDCWAEVKPETPFYLFVRQNNELSAEYGQGWQITDIAPINSTGIKTHRDHFAISFDVGELRKRIEDFRNLKLLDSQIVESHTLKDTRDWKIHTKRISLSALNNWETFIQPHLYRAFDTRFIFNHTDILELPRSEVMEHMSLGANIALGTNRQVNGEFRHVICNRLTVNDCTLSSEFDFAHQAA